MRRIAFTIVSIALCALVFAHPGGIDKDGCHKESATGERHCHPERAPKKKAVPVCDQPAPKPGKNVMHGRVTKVVDGDTFNVEIQGIELSFRLSDIDAPEHDQPYGTEAKKALHAAIYGDDVVMQKVDKDSRGRFVVHVWLRDVYVNREMVAQGAAWFYAKYAHGDCLYEVEQEARDAKRGFWALPLEQRQAPWEWRHDKHSVESAPASQEKNARGK